MSEPGRMDLEALLADALRPIEPPEKVVGPRRGHPLGNHRGGRRGPWKLGRGALRFRARVASRPQELGAPRRRSGDRRRRRRSARRGRGPPPPQANRPASQHQPPDLRPRQRPAPSLTSAASRRLAGRSRFFSLLFFAALGFGVAAPAARPVRPRIRWRKLSSVFTGTVENNAPRSPSMTRKPQMIRGGRPGPAPARTCGRRGPRTPGRGARLRCG